MESRTQFKKTGSNRKATRVGKKLIKMKKKLKEIILLFAISVSIMGCSSDGDSNTDSVDYVKDAASLMRNMKLDGATIKTGDVPFPEGELTDVITSMPRTVVVTTNSLFRIPIQTTTTDGRIPRIVFIKLEGSDKYYQIDIDENGIPVASNRSSNNPPPRIPLSCTGGSNVRLEANGFQETPSYENPAEVYTFSPPVQAAPADFGSFFTDRTLWSKKSITFKALDVGTGDVQVSLTWDTETDVDLWLTEPNSNKIWYANKQSSTGGELDFDNTSGYGPENIFYQNTAPSGTYKVEVNYFSRRNVTTGTNYNVVVKNGSQITSYDGTLTVSSQTDVVTTFTK